MRVRALLILPVLLLVFLLVSVQGEAQGPPQCADHIDNDGDGRTDFPMDSGCASPVDPGEDEPFGGVPECADRIDNNSDGKTDYPDDRGCVSAADTREQPPPALVGCSDGSDNDRDGATDYPGDPGCIAASDPTEDDVECADRRDNDGDGKVDHPADDGCSVPSNVPDQTDNSEGGAAVNAPAPSPPAGPSPSGGMPGQPSLGKSGKAHVTLKVWSAKPRKGKVRFVFTGTLRSHPAPAGARVAIRVREGGRWKQFLSPAVVDGKFKASRLLRRSGRVWRFQARTLHHPQATYTTGKSPVVRRRAR